jgi:hypothetical protein
LFQCICLNLFEHVYDRNVCLFVLYVWICLNMSMIWMSIYLYAYLYVYLSIYLSILYVWMCLNMSMIQISIYLFVYQSICQNTCVFWIYLFVASFWTLLWNVDLVLAFDTFTSTLINFCSFSTMIINDFCKWAWISKWSQPSTYPNLMFVFGVIHLEFYFKTWPYAWCVQ